MSRGDETLEKSIVRADGLLEILDQTLDRVDMPGDIRDKYKHIVKQDDLIKRFHLGLTFGDRKYALRMSNKIEEKMQSHSNIIFL